MSHPARYRSIPPVRRRAAAGLGRPLLLISLLLFLLASAVATAQTVETFGNRFIRANVDLASGSGRFWISAGPAVGNYKFLYGNSFFITSNIIFRVTSGGADHYYSNIPLDFPYRPTVALDTEVAFKPYDDIYKSDDTLALTWAGMEGFTVTMRLLTEKESSEFDGGGDMVMEFSYAFDPLYPPATLGIFMMLDSYNSQAGGVEGESSILTSDRYFPVGKGGKLYASVPDSIPEFYQVGSFRYEQPLNTVLPIHRLKGRSHGGRPLTPPHTFAVSDWADLLRDAVWVLGGPRIEITPINDCATASRWEGLTGSGTVRTAFGVSDREGNNLFPIHDSALFADVRTVRVVEQTARNGPYTPSPFDVDMWVANFNTSAPATIWIRMDTIAAADGLVLDPATPAAQSVEIPASGTGHIRWKLGMAPGAQIARADVPLNFSYHMGDSVWRRFREDVAPVITIRGFRGPAEDTLAPVITRTGSTDTPVKRWTFRTFDRHPGYPDDKGLDAARPVANRNQNVKIESTVPSSRCNVALDADVTATVIDPARPAKLVLAVYDCAGNIAYDSASYTPPDADTMAPAIVRVDSAKGRWTFRAADRHAGYTHDTGIDTIRVDVEWTENFTLESTSFNRCDTAVTVNLAAVVADTARGGKIIFTVTDCRGNVARDSAVYVRATTGVDLPGEASTGGARMTILEIRPQPLVASAGRMIEVKIGGMRAGRSAIDLVAPDGRIVARYDAGAVAGGTVSHALNLPSDLPSGVYMLRVIGGAGTASAKVVVVE